MLLLFWKHFKRKYLQRLDPDATWFMLALRATVACMLAVLIVKFTLLPQPIFLILTTVLLMLLNVIDDKQLRFKTLLYTGLLGSLGVFVVTALTFNLMLLIMALFILSFLTIYIGKYGLHTLLAGFIVLIDLILAAGIPADISVASARLCICLLGTLIALTVSFIIMPESTARRMRKTLGLTVQELGEFFYHSMLDSLRGNQLRLRYREIKYHIFQCLQKGRKLEQAINADKATHLLLTELIEAIDRLAENIFAITSTVNNPVNAFAFINVQSELKIFVCSIYTIFQGMAVGINTKSLAIDLPAFKHTVNDLETNLHAVLSVSEHKSVFFQWPFELGNLLYSLTSLTDEFTHLQQLIVNYNEN